MATKVRPAGRWSVPAELRRQLALAFTSAGIRLNRRTVASQQGQTAPDDASGTGSAPNA
jgi:hypothetical protein